MSTGRPSLPEYAHPPLVAATLGVYLREAMDITPQSLAEYQGQLGPEWIGDWTERPLDSVDGVADAGLMSGGWQLRNVLHDRVIHISQRHFAFTWLGTADTRYPRYENVRDGFVAAWDCFAEQQRTRVKDLKQWAVCYLNRIPQGTVWQNPKEWSFFRLMPDSPRLLEQLTSAHWLLKTPGVDEGLSIDWNFQSAPGSADDSTIWLRLTARGSVGVESSAVLDGMDAGRAAIVQTFSDLLSPAANAYWGLRRREK